MRHITNRATAVAPGEQVDRSGTSLRSTASARSRTVRAVLAAAVALLAVLVGTGATPGLPVRPDRAGPGSLLVPR